MSCDVGEVTDFTWRAAHGWEDNTQTDLTLVKIKNWRTFTHERKERKAIVEKAKIFIN